MLGCEGCRGLFAPEDLDDDGWCTTCLNNEMCADCHEVFARDDGMEILPGQYLCDGCACARGLRQPARSDGAEAQASSGAEAQASSGKRAREEEDLESADATQAEIELLTFFCLPLTLTLPLPLPLTLTLTLARRRSSCSPSARRCAT